MAKEIDLKKYNFRNFRGPMTLTLTLDRVTRHTVVQQSSTPIYIPNFIEIGKTFSLTYAMDMPTDIHFRPPLMLLGQLTRRSRPNKLQNGITVSTLLYLSASLGRRWGKVTFKIQETATLLPFSYTSLWYHILNFSTSLVTLVNNFLCFQCFLQH